MQVWSPNHKTTPVTRDGMQVWTWTSSQTKASARDENGKMTVGRREGSGRGRRRAQAAQRGMDHLP